MLIDFILQNYWLVAVSISFIYISDYFWTLKTSQLYQSGVNRCLEVEGGIELNPLYRKDINQLKKYNFKFLLILIGLNLLLFIVWFTTVILGHNSSSFELVFGSFILTEFFVHTRHFKNYFQAKSILKGGEIEGHIKYSRSFMHKATTIDALAFAFIYLFLWLLFGRSFFLGGVIACLSLSFMQKFWCKKYLKTNNSNLP